LLPPLLELEELEDELLLEDDEDELLLDELLELELELLLELVVPPQAPRLVHEASPPGTVVVYQFA
jgi:hypothetical protein